MTNTRLQHIEEQGSVCIIWGLEPSTLWRKIEISVKSRAAEPDSLCSKTGEEVSTLLQEVHNIKQRGLGSPELVNGKLRKH